MQYANERNARAAVAGEDGRMIVGQVLGEGSVSEFSFKRIFLFIIVLFN